jgi:DnaK suppressor protein
MNLRPDDLETARSRLDEEMETVQRELRDLGATPEGSVEVVFDEGFADAALSTAERDKVLSLVATLRHRADDIRVALHRLERGVYSVCENCGGPIEAERLEAIQTARRCIRCAQKR